MAHHLDIKENNHPMLFFEDLFKGYTKILLINNFLLIIRFLNFNSKGF
jgi:hypothetical protein